MKNKIYYGVIILLLIINVIILSVYVRHEKRTKIIIKTLAQYPDQRNAVLNNFHKNISYARLDLPKDITMKDTIGNEYNLYDTFLLKNKITLIVRFSENYCQSCVEYAIGVIKTVLNEHVDMPTIFIGNSIKNSLFAANIENLNLQEEDVYNCNDLKIGIEYHGFPYYLFVDNEAQVRGCYFPTKKMDKFDIEQIYKLYKLIGN